MTHLVQLLLPVYDNHGRRIAPDHFGLVRIELMQKFGGATFYTRAPAVGLWKNDEGTVDQDDVIMVEIVVDRLDAQWWAGYRHTLEHRFSQDEILVRAFPIERL
jgi:hypothetical protein